MKKGFVIIWLFVLILISSISFSSAESIRSCAAEGKMCGGIAGIICCSGLTCDYGSNEGNPDAAGVCVTKLNETKTLKEYYDSIDYSCQQDSDCAIKDVHKCCGVDYACVNKNAIVDANIVRQACENERVVSTCDVNLVSSCSCAKGKCIGKQREPEENNNSNCPQWVSHAPDYCKDGIIIPGKLNENGCQLPPNCITNKTFNLSNGRKAEIKIMPETASEKAIERLGELNFTIELKEVGAGDKSKAVYELKTEKQGRFLGLFKINGNIAIQVDAETGEVIKIKKPWWAFLVSGI